jgi:hypothetical protein
MSQNVRLLFLDEWQNKKENPLNKYETNLLKRLGDSLAKKLESGIKIVFQKNGSRDYTVGVFDDNSTLLASKHGEGYRKMGLQVIQTANKNAKRRNFQQIN